MRIFDITLAMDHSLPGWPGDPTFVLGQVSSMDAGKHVNISQLACSVHTGTHVDAPHHFLNDHCTVEALDLDMLVGPAQVVQIPDEAQLVTAGILDNAKIPLGTLRLLLKTRNSLLWQAGSKEFDRDFVGVSADGAQWLVDRGVGLVGIDYLSIAPYQQSGPTHLALLQADIIILEGVDLSRVIPGRYELFCLPLKLVGSDGAPARVILTGR